MNSKKIKKGDTFLVNNKNEGYVNEAIKNGASLIVSEMESLYDIETKNVKSIKEYLRKMYKFIDNLSLIGITGTNGKTTTCYLIYQILNYMKIKTAYIGTNGFHVDDKVLKLDNTTPSMDILYNLLKDAYDLGCKVVVMEVSSHALKQDRVYGLLYDAIAVTNITEDHLDYHKNIYDYINSKRLLINKLRNDKICVLNKNDKYYKKFIDKKNKNYIIGKNIKILKEKINIDNTELVFKDDKIYSITLPLVGKFNIYNYLIAYKIIKSLGYDEDEIMKFTSKIKEPLGRMQKIYYKKNAIFIDYAHTPDAVLNVLKTVNEIKNNGIITIIGCGGNREKEKRPIMAKIACKYSSYVIFTNDNPRFEDEKEIVKDMLCGAKGKYEIIYDRDKAIETGIGMLKENMILMILGKGHEDYQIIKDKKIHFSDIETVNKILSDIE